MVGGHRHVIIIAALLAGVASGIGAPRAQSPKPFPSPSSEADLTALIERIQNQDKEAAQDGFLLQQFRGAPRSGARGSQVLKLSLGEVGSKDEASPFDNDPDPRFTYDPIADPDPMPGVGLNLKMKF
jgi:hypothetical protein